MSMRSPSATVTMARLVALRRPQPVRVRLRLPSRVMVLTLFTFTPKTKAALTALRSITDARRVLLVLDREDELTWKSLRNAPQVHLLFPDQLNTYDVLVADDVVFTKAAFDEFCELASSTGRQSPGRSETSGEGDE